MQLNKFARQNCRELHLAALTSCHVNNYLTDYYIICTCDGPTGKGTVHLLMMTKSNPEQGRCKLTQAAAHMRPPISLLNAVTDAPFPTVTDGCEEFVLGEPGQTFKRMTSIR